jgi:tRNA dimethylallyltransferase
MTPEPERRRLIAVVGATATGKTALAIALTQALDGEIIGADSRQVYRGMDIGTAKPTAAEQAAARHWLIDVVSPDEPFTLADYLDRAHAAAEDVWARGRQPILAGGTGQYVWAMLEGWRVPRVAPDADLRARLERKAKSGGVAALMDELRRVDLAWAEKVDAKNPRRIIRAIEVTVATGRPYSAWRTKVAPSFQSSVLGLYMDRGDLYRRIDARVDAMMAAGLLDEVRGLIAEGYGCELPSMSGIGYRLVCEHLRGERELADAVARIKTETHRLARMQHTWFRRDDPNIAWFDAGAPDLAASAARYVTP